MHICIDTYLFTYFTCINDFLSPMIYIYDIHLMNICLMKAMENCLGFTQHKALPIKKQGEWVLSTLFTEGRNENRSYFHLRRGDHRESDVQLGSLVLIYRGPKFLLLLSVTCGTCLASPFKSEWKVFVLDIKQSVKNQNVNLEKYCYYSLKSCFNFRFFNVI